MLTVNNQLKNVLQFNRHRVSMNCFNILWLNIFSIFKDSLPSQLQGNCLALFWYEKINRWYSLSLARPVSSLPRSIYKFQSERWIGGGMGWMSSPRLFQLFLSFCLHKNTSSFLQANILRNFKDKSETLRMIESRIPGGL